MDSERIIRLLEEQLRFSGEQNAQAMEREKVLLEQNRAMACRIEILTESVRSLEEALLTKDASVEKIRNKCRALGKLATNKIAKDCSPPPLLLL